MQKINRIGVKDPSKHHTYHFNGIQVFTPHPIYQSQNIFIDYIINCLQKQQNALIQSPTGTGKTMSLLCSTIAWAMNFQQNKHCDPPQIIYASRTHAQLKQVINQANKLCYGIKLAILGSRDHSCVNEDLKLLKGQDKELQCRLRIAQKKGLSCKFYKHETYYQKQASLGKMLDLEEISLAGKLQCFCPFFYERFSRAIANLVLIPYNYLFDKNVWSTEQGLRLEGSILILDEAHNIQSVCQQYREFSISLSIFTRAIQHLSELRMEKLNQGRNVLDPSILDKIKVLKINIQDIEINASFIQQIYQTMQTLDIPTDQSGLILSSTQFVKLLQNSTQKGKFGSILEQVDKLVERFRDFRTDLLFYPFWALERWMKFVEKVQELKGCLQAQKEEFKIQLLYEGADIKINILCLDPSAGFNEVIKQHKPRSIILTSGTLSPLKMWPIQLKAEFAQPVSCPHVLGPHQAQTVILSRGSSGSSLDTRFQNRKSATLFEDIGNALYEIVKNTANGVVALFPSYAFLEQTKTSLTSQKILTKLYEQKDIFFERKEADFTHVLQSYMKKAQSTKGALLCALIRGKVSEGLDFSHNKCRAVILVGVPYPYSKDVKIIAKKKYLDTLSKKDGSSINGTQWYLAETVRAINQGIGRLIRSPDDFGTVYLLDERFGKQDIEAQLASWARLNLSKPSTYLEFVKKIKEINQVKELSAQERIIKEDFGLVSVKGSSLFSQSLAMPLMSVRQSISRPVVPKKTQQQQADQSTKNMSLNQLMTTMKTNKQSSQIEKKAKQVQEQELLEKQQKNRITYEQKLFRTKIKPVQKKSEQQPCNETCPVCQIEAPMVKSNTCQHALCQQCWDRWLTQDLRCPICRGRVRKNFLFIEK